MSELHLSRSGPVTTSYRSPLAAARRGLFYCEGEPNLYNMSDNDFRLVIFMMYFAGWQVSDDNGGSYDMKMLFPHPREESEALLCKGWIHAPNPANSLSRMTVPAMKAMAAQYGVALKSSKKADILNALLHDLPDDVLAEYAALRWYIDLTPQGFHVLRSLYNERIEIILRVSRLLLHGERNAADLVAAAYWQKRAILTHPSMVMEIPKGLSLKPVEASVLAANAYFMGDDIIKVFFDYWGEHDDVVMHRGILEFLYPELLQ